MSPVLPSFVQNLILLAIPLLTTLLVWLCQQFVFSLPIQQRQALEQFARMAVHKIEQQESTLSGTVKKQLAIDLVVKLFRTFKIPVPPSEAIDAAIEAAVFLSKQLLTTSGSPSSSSL